MIPSTFTVLIVEDLPVNRELYRYCLLDDASCVYSVLEAESVADGLELCRTRSIDAILLDYALPDGNGLEFLEQLAFQNTQSPSVVMMTGHGDESVAVRAMKLGAEDYLAKHKFTPELLRQAMYSAIESGKSRRLGQLKLVPSHSANDRERFFDLSIDLLAIANFDLYFTRLNPAWEKLLGFTSAELMARPYLDFVHPDDRARTLLAAQRIGRGETIVSFENRYRCQDGSYRWLLWSAMPSIEQQAFYAIAHDITAAKLDEVIRQQAQIDLEQRNHELNSFVHIVSHDLKAPLRAISNLSEWIEEDFQGELSVHSQQQMTMLRSRVHSLERTIDELLDYARIGRTNDKIESVDVAKLLAVVIEAISPPAQFSIEIAPMPTIDTNRLLLSQVFANLIGNAIDHHDRCDGSIQITARSCANLDEFAISDDGAGIALEYHERIFGIFQAINPQQRPNSTGVGLAIVKKIVEAEGGTIWLESQLGRGTTFYFTWPRQLRG
jgi:PAS domain S-box-containing protein